MTYTAFINKLNFFYARHLRSSLYRADTLKKIDQARAEPRNNKDFADFIADLADGYVDELGYDLCGIEEDLMGIEKEIYDLIYEASKETWYDSFESTHLQTFSLLKEDAQRFAPGEGPKCTPEGFSF